MCIYIHIETMKYTPAPRPSSRTLSRLFPPTSPPGFPLRRIGDQSRRSRAAKKERNKKKN